MAVKKRGVKPGTKRGPYQKSETSNLLEAMNISDILDKRMALRLEVKARIKQLNQLLKRI